MVLRLAILEGADGIIFTPYGDSWRQTCKICTVKLLNAWGVRSFRTVQGRKPAASSTSWHLRH
jgi:hypothetical protein